MELQNQEYEFDPKDVSWPSKACDGANEPTQDDGHLTEQCDATSRADELFTKPQTPVSSLAQSPFPPSMFTTMCCFE